MHKLTRYGVALISLLGCAAQAQDGGTIAKVKSSGEVRVAYRESSIPFSYLGEGGQPVGFGWEICGKVVEQLKKATAAPT